MSIVCRETLVRLREEREILRKGNINYELAYQMALRTLDSSLSLLEQVDHITDGITVQLHKG